MTIKTAYHHGDLRQTLLDQAASLLQQEGEQGLSMRVLAANAGVSRTAPYHHFKDKQDLLCAVAVEGFQRFVGSLSMEGIDPSEESLQDFVRGYLNFAIRNAGYYDLMFGSQLWKSNAVNDTLQREAYAAFRFYVGQVVTWQNQNKISPSLDPLRYAQVSWSTLHGMCRLLIDGIYIEPGNMEPMCNQAGSMFWRQLQAWDGPTQPPASS